MLDEESQSSITKTVSLVCKQLYGERLSATNLESIKVIVQHLLGIIQLA